MLIVSSCILLFYLSFNGVSVAREGFIYNWLVCCMDLWRKFSYPLRLYGPMVSVVWQTQISATEHVFYINNNLKGQHSGHWSDTSFPFLHVYHWNWKSRHLLQIVQELGKRTNMTEFTLFWLLCVVYFRRASDWKSALCLSCLDIQGHIRQSNSIYNCYASYLCYMNNVDHSVTPWCFKGEMGP